MTNIDWKPRRPTWPYLAALGCLFCLTLGVPWAWQRTRVARQQQPDGPVVNRLESTVAVPVPKPQVFPTVPPLAAPSAPEPELSGPMVLADDYVAVDEPLVESSAAVDSPDDRGSPPMTLRPANRSVLVRNSVAPPAAGPRLQFNKESLIRVRDAILAMVEHARQMEQQAAAIKADGAPALASPMRVIVESENDRLAMVPPAERGQFTEPSLAPTPAEPIVAPALRHRPKALIEQLQSLANADRSAASSWARRALTHVEQLCEGAPPPNQNWQAAIVQLRRLAADGYGAALVVTDPAEQSAWVRASRALDRRLPVWTLLVDPQFMRGQSIPMAAALNDHAGLLQALNDVADLTAGTEEGAMWRQYLRIDDIAGLTSVGGDEYVESRRAVARDVLVRMNDPWLTAAQRQFLAQPPVTHLAVELRPWASGEASIDTLAAFIERFESTGSLRDADAIAELRLRMKWSADPRLQSLADELNRSYRNANVRVAFAAELMNRMIPPQEVRKAPVRSRIVGADVRGRSETETDVRIRLIPDPAVWRIGLEAAGKVRSRTVSDTWPARLQNYSDMNYEARKLVLVNRFGVHVWPAEAQADGQTKLVGVESGLSPVPIIGAIVEGAAREQHRQNRRQAVAQVKQRVSKEARQRMDAEADAKLANIEVRVREHLLEPLDRFAVIAEPVDMNTTEDRVQARLRLATEQHLGAHTPRPSAPSDSLASFQLHESAFNNALRGLELDGRRMTVGELHHALVEKIRRRAEVEPADLPRAAKVEFAAQDAVRIVCRNDQVELVLNIVELRHGRDSIRGVGVHAFFRPVIDGLELKLVRDGTLQFRGAHLRTGPRMVLHSVFGKLLPKDQELPVLTAKLNEDSRFAGLMVTQLVIDDGWLAMSIGPAHPNRVAWRTRTVDVK